MIELHIVNGGEISINPTQIKYFFSRVNGGSALVFIGESIDTPLYVEESYDTLQKCVRFFA